jgi:hypothetical protein
MYLRPTTAAPVDTQTLQVSAQAKGGPVVIQPQSVPASTLRTTGLLRRNAISVLVEQFGGMNDQPPLHLKASLQTTDRALVNELVSEVNALPAFPNEVMSCRADDGSYFVLVFTYASGPATSVKAEATGCGGVYLGGSNRAVAWTATTPAFLETLRWLLSPWSLPRSASSTRTAHPA